MIKLFRKVRQQMLAENKFSKYLLYAVGEIVLVVIGILIALNINNDNDQRKQRTRELHYLKNVNSDLQINVKELNSFIVVRTGYMESAKTILNQFHPDSGMSFSEYNQLSLPLYNWEKFYQNDNTYQELLNSGNLALVSNDSIKNMLQNLALLFKKLKSEEDHYRFDAEKTFYEPQYKFVDLNVLVENFMYHVSDGQSGSNIEPTKAELKQIYSSISLKNGFTLSILEYDKMNGQMQEMIELSETLISSIEKELTTN